MFSIDPLRVELAKEFKHNPLGIHSPELHAVLTTMRGMPIRGKHILVMTKPHREWTLAVMEGDPLRPKLIPDAVFQDPIEAEWCVFKLRWQALTGEVLNVS